MKTPFENFKKADWAIVAGGIAILAILVMTTFGVNKFLYKTPVLEEKDVYFTVFFRGITITDKVSPIQVNDNAFITIRNVPYKKLEIVEVKAERRMRLIETATKGNYQLVEDMSVPFVYDFMVTLKDKAKITEDGAVVGGNKLKMGLPVIIEGARYKYTGVISNLQFEENVAAPQQEQSEQQ